MIRGFVSSDEDDDYDFGYSEPLVLNKPEKVPFPEIKNLDFKEKLTNAQHQIDLNQLLMSAIEQEDLSALTELVERGVDVNGSSPQEWTPLMKACVMGKHEAVRFLLEKGSDPNKHKELFTPLMACCTHTVVAEALKLNCLRLLLQEGAKVNATDKYRSTALMYATGSGYLSIVTELLQSPEINVNLQDKEGWTALFYAVNHYNIRTVEKLISAGANLQLKDNQGRTALQLALEKELIDVAEMLGYVEDVEIKTPPDKINFFSQYLAELPDPDGNGGFYSDARDILGVFNQSDVEDISLSDLLNATDKDLFDIGVKLEFDRCRILSKGIHKFHLEPWKKSSLIAINSKEPLGLEAIISITGGLAKHLTVVNASLRYLDTRISKRQERKVKDLSIEEDTLMILVNCYGVAEKLKVILLRLLKNSEEITLEESPDYIYPAGKKTKNYFWSVVGGVATTGLLIYCCRMYFNLKPVVKV